MMWTLLCFLAVTGAVHIPEDCKNVTLCGQLPWSEWIACSQSCGGGSQTRKREICGLPEWGEEEVEDRCGKPLRIEHRVCNAVCLNDGLFADDTCICKPGKTGKCCENDLLPLDSLTSSKEKAFSFLRKSGSRSKRDDHIDEECRELGSCDHEEVREWIRIKHIHKSVCQWMKDRRCGERGCGAGYRCDTTNYDCSRYINYTVGCTDINECNSNPCMHGGMCHNLINRFTCSCPGGYHGTRCEYDINECDSNPCMHGGACHNLLNRFTCSCPGGYHGTRCEYDTNECDSNPCMHGGTCHNQLNRFTCSCPGGYHGTRCEYDINECDSNPCMHGATCHNLLNRFTCSCPGGYHGSRCEYDTNECDSNPCMHGGTCHNLLNRFTCSCPGGYHGTRCEYDINECDSNPCMHGAICHNLLNRFTCSCPGGYHGSRCEYHTDECDSNPCMHGGQCHNLLNRFTCSCPDGYHGTRCEFDINECDSSPCKHGGTCHNLVNGFTCSCPDMYSGTRCENEKCRKAPTVINCPNGIQELNFTKPTENITFSTFDHLSDIHGESCDGEILAINFPETELTWNRAIQNITLTVNDNRGLSTLCVLGIKINDMIPPSFLDCPKGDIVQYGSNDGSIVTWSPIHVQDNSGNVTISSSKVNGVFMKFGRHLISYNATDEFGNTNQCNFTVNVKKLPKSVCDIPPPVFHGVISCHDVQTLSCGIDRCEQGYLQTNNQSHVCSNGIWKPTFSSEFVSSSCIKPEPTHLERNYTFRFNCPNLKFTPPALRDCIQQLDLCPSGDILLCDKPFQRIEGKHVSSTDLQIRTTLEGILPYEANRDGLINRMDSHGNTIAAYFKNGKFKEICHQLKCEFEHIKAASLREVCGNGTVEFIMHGKRICRKCGPGWFYDYGDCVQCSEGSYQDQYGQRDCKKCPDGTTSPIGTFMKSRCFVKVIVEKQTSSFNTLTVVGISISGLLLIVFIVLIVMVNKWRLSVNRTTSDSNRRSEEQAKHPGFEESLPEIYDEIKEDGMFGGYIILKPGISNADGVYESLPERRRAENPYTTMSWRNY